MSQYSSLVDPQLKGNIILGRVERMPNEMQLAVSIYTAATCLTTKRVVVEQPPGVGKQREQWALAVLLLEKNIAKRVILVHTCESIQYRETSDFHDYPEMLTAKGNLEFRRALPDDCKFGDVVVVDELDYFLYKDPVAFKRFAERTSFVGFTASTPDAVLSKLEDQVTRSLRAKVIS